MNDGAVADRDIIADDCRICAAVDMNAAIILNVCVHPDENIVIVAAHRYLMPDAAVRADSNSAHYSGCRRNKHRILNFWNEVQKGCDKGLFITVAPVMAITCHHLPPVIGPNGNP